MKGRVLIVLVCFSIITAFIFKIIERLSCVDVKGPPRKSMRDHLTFMDEYFQCSRVLWVLVYL